MKKKIVYVDMDGVLVNFKSGIEQLSEKTKQQYENRLDEVPGIFSLMTPVKNAIEAITELHSYYDIYILSTAPWENPTAWSDKLLWIQKYLPKIGYKRLILTHNKQLNKGDYLIDDRRANGASNFEGKHIYFGKGNNKDWMAVYNFLIRDLLPLKIDREIETELINKIKKNKNRVAINTLSNFYKHIFEVIILQYSNDLSSKEHKMLQSKAKKGFINGVMQYKSNLDYSFTAHVVWFIRQEIISYKMKKAGKVRSPFVRGLWSTKEEVKKIRKRLRSQNKDKS